MKRNKEYFEQIGSQSLTVFLHWSHPASSHWTMPLEEQLSWNDKYGLNT